MRIKGQGLGHVGLACDKSRRTVTARHGTGLWLVHRGTRARIKQRFQVRDLPDKNRIRNPRRKSPALQGKALGDGEEGVVQRVKKGAQ